MPKLTKKQTRKLFSRKTKNLLKGGGVFRKIKSAFRKKTKTVPQQPSSSFGKARNPRNPLPSLPNGTPGRPAKPSQTTAVPLVPNQLYGSSSTSYGYARLAPRRPAASTGSLRTIPGYSELSPRGNLTYVPVSRGIGNQTLYASTPSLPGIQLERLSNLTTQPNNQISKFTRRGAVKRSTPNPILNKINRYEQLAAKSRNTLSTENRNKLIGLQMEIERLRLPANTSSNLVKKFLNTKQQIRGRLNSSNAEMLQKAEAELQRQKFENAGRSNLESAYGDLPPPIANK